MLLKHIIYFKIVFKYMKLIENRCYKAYRIKNKGKKEVSELVSVYICLVFSVVNTLWLFFKKLCYYLYWKSNTLFSFKNIEKIFNC